MCFLPCWLFVIFGIWRNFWGCVRGWNKSNRKGRTGKKRWQNVYAPMLRVLNCVLLTVKVKLFLEVENEERERERERECCLYKSKCERMSSWKNRIYIGNPCHVVGSKSTGLNQRCGRSCDHKSCDFPDQ